MGTPYDTLYIFQGFASPAPIWGRAYIHITIRYCTLGCLHFPSLAPIIFFYEIKKKMKGVEFTSPLGEGRG